MSQDGMFVEGKYVGQDDATILVKSFSGKQWSLRRVGLGEADRVFLDLIKTPPDYDSMRLDHVEYVKDFQFRSSAGMVAEDVALPESQIESYTHAHHDL